jgi:protein SCO1/2
VKLVGTVIPHPAAAPDFTLTDQKGLPFHMANTKGKVVVVTFIYTHCTDLRPFVTMKLKNAREQLGTDADKAVFVAVTTDPKRDTQNVIAAYSRAAGLFDS